MKTGKEILASIVVVMAVVVAAVIGALIVSAILTNSVFDDIAVTGTNTNETLSSVTNITAKDFAILSTYPTATCTLSTVYNSTSGEVLTAGNYTHSVCTLILEDDSAYIGEDLNVTYDFSRPSGTSLGGVDAGDVADSYGAFVTALLAFIAIIGTIIGIVWLVYYVKLLFNRNQGLQSMTS